MGTERDIQPVAIHEWCTTEAPRINGTIYCKCFYLWGWPYINTHQIESVVVLYTRRRPPKRKVGFVDGLTRPHLNCRLLFFCSDYTCWRNWRRGAINVKLGEGPSLSPNRGEILHPFLLLRFLLPKAWMSYDTIYFVHEDKTSKKALIWWIKFWWESVKNCFRYFRGYVIYWKVLVWIKEEAMRSLINSFQLEIELKRIEEIPI